MEIGIDRKFLDTDTDDLIVSYIIEDKGETSYGIYNYSKKEVKGFEKEEYIEPLHQFFKNRDITIHGKKHLYNN